MVKWDRNAKCKKGDSRNCKNVECTYEGWESETYECKVCGLYYKLYYDDMR